MTIKKMFEIFKRSKREILSRPYVLKSHNNIINKVMLGMILGLIVMIDICIVVISQMKTTFIFYLMTLLHLM